MRHHRNRRAKCETSPGAPLLHLLYYLLQLMGQWRRGLLFHYHRAIPSAPDDDVMLAPVGILIGEIFAELSAAAFLSQQGGACNGLADVDKIGEIHGGVPAVVVLAVARNPSLLGPSTQLADGF